jgi:hypothetical protein
MICALCSRGNLLHHPGCATCAMCLNSVCTDDCRRPDGHSHGARCECGCPGTFCRPDLKDHVDEAHGGSISNCFPGQGGLLGLQAFAMAGAAYYRGAGRVGVGMEMARIWNEFLNVVSPGTKALQTVRLPRGEYEVDPVGVAWPGKVRVEFRMRFFAAGTLERVAALAASEFRIAASRGYTGKGVPLPYPVGPGVLDVLQRHGHATEDQIWAALLPMKPRQMRPGEERSYRNHRVRQEVLRHRRTHSWFAYALSLEVPQSPHEIAAWLVQRRTGATRHRVS